MDLTPVFDLVSVDVETTGLNDQKDEIVEVTAIEFNRSNKIGKIITKLCKPMSNYINPEATAVNHITIDMVKNCPNYLTDGIREEIAAFIGERTVVGHNVLSFDIKFLRISPKKVIDTLLLCRDRYRGGNKLKTACIRANIEWNDSESHRSEYDAKKCIELYCKLFVSEEAERIKKMDAPLFAMPAEVQQLYSAETSVVKNLASSEDINNLKLGVVISERDKQMFATQTYSYSRLNLFNQCPFKWYMQYVKNLKEPDKNYFKTGKICHRIAEKAGEWCYEELFKNKFCIYAESKHIKIFPEDEKIIESKYLNKGIRGLAEYLYDVRTKISSYFPGLVTISDLIFDMDKTIDHNTYEKPSMPDLASYNAMVENAINYYKCEDPDVILEVRNIMNRFYTLKDFSLTPGDLTLTEKRLVFDKDWKSLKDFYANDAYFRGIIDVLSYFGDYVVITDYKSSRKMMSIKELMEDHQTMTYILLAYKFLPERSFNKIIVRIEYVRFGETIEYEINNPKEVAERALLWINTTIQSIEQEILKTDGTAFQPTRNEYCHTCWLGEDGMCPLFNKLISGKLDDPFACSVSSVDECRAAWKRIETNKAEIERLSKLCKSFTKQCEDPIVIDKKAKLDFYLTKFREYDTRKTVELLLRKNIEMTEFINYLSISPSQLKDLLEDKGIELTTEELDSISKVKSKATFDAFTSEEATSKGFINP